MIPRHISSYLVRLATRFPVLTLTGPRQSGKTTLLRHLFKDHRYVNLENLDIRAEAEEDPRGFLRRHAEGVVLDEVQRVPALFSYVQSMVDESGEMGRYILSGSLNFLLMSSVSQSLAGRAAVLHLLPFSIGELPPESSVSLDQRLLLGGYPPLYDRQLKAGEFYPSYLETYVERDVRGLRNIGNLSLFRKFLMLCAGRSGQLLNLTALGNEVGVDHKTIESWISVLEAGFLVYRLPPYHRSWNKRVVKQPKLIFLDTGVLCAILGIRGESDLRTHPLRGAVFESWVVSEALKYQMNRGLRPTLFFWRDHSGHEIDLLMEEAGRARAIEIKSGETVVSSWLEGLKWLQKVAGDQLGAAAVVHGGERSTKRKDLEVISWRKAQSAFA
ncbi:MAG: ATP-binding protein [Opitutales bacterium]|nr:ATP-binding protein [Opitutales bacterium]